jgi:PAS domain S-box-containing protein
MSSATGHPPSQPPVIPSNESLQGLFDMSIDLLGTASLDGYFTLLNPAWERMLGWSDEALMGQPYMDFVHPDDVEASTEAATKLATPGGGPVIGFENRYRTSEGSYRTLEWDVNSNEALLFFVAHDVTDRRAKELEERQSASLMQAVIENVADGLYVGNSRGQITLINPAAVRLLGYDSAHELYGRGPHRTFHHKYPSGAPFPVSDCPLTKVRMLGATIHAEEDAFWRKDGSILPVSYSSAPIELSDGTGSVVAFRDITIQKDERDRQRALSDDLEWIDIIRDALDDNRFVLYAQPVISLTTGAVAKHELLLRMISPDGDVIGPDKFLPIAERFGLIDRIDRWVITHGIETALNGKPVAINLSATSMNNAGILLHIEREIERTGASPDRLTFELTETAVMHDLKEGRRFADRLVALGCTFALDDFGVGFASLTYLRELPITFVKIDGRFINAVTLDESDSTFVEAIVHMVHALGKLTIAEGIEDEQTLSKLRSFGVDLGQGFHIGRPSPVFSELPHSGAAAHWGKTSGNQ